MKRTRIAAVAAAVAVTLGGCLAGEADEGGQSGADELDIDFATYNPLSLIIREHGWLEDALAEDGVTVNWIQSAGSNKANELLRSGELDVGSTAGSAALLARANHSPIRTIDIYSQPEWSALVTRPGSGIEEVTDLRGRSIAATKGTDPYFFLLQSLLHAGVDPAQVTIQNLQHADGYTALQNGAVDAWAGLDPIMASAQQEDAELFYRNVDFNTYGFLNAREDFLTDEPELAQTVVDAYEYARAWAQEHPDETVAVLADVAGIERSVAETVITERSNLDVEPAPGQAQLDVLTTIGPMLVETGDVAEQSQIDDALDTLLDDSWVAGADPGAFAAVAEGGS